MEVVSKGARTLSGRLFWTPPRISLESRSECSPTSNHRISVLTKVKLPRAARQLWTKIKTLEFGAAVCTFEIRRPQSKESYLRFVGQWIRPALAKPCLSPPRLIPRPIEGATHSQYLQYPSTHRDTFCLVIVTIAPLVLILPTQSIMEADCLLLN